ncbi:MAG: PEP-CTERM sorting domain-containing protein [Pirellulales bacterium]
MKLLIFNVPEPSSIMLFSLAGIGYASRRRRKRS